MRILRSPLIKGAVPVAAICVIAAFRVAATHSIFSPTYDEPVHVASGFQYLTEHRYTIDHSHPPFARAVFAFPLRHATLIGTDGFDRIGQLYASAGDYMTGVVASRRGNLIFFVLSIIGVALWTAQLFGNTTAMIAAAIFSLQPPVIAHAGLATTDMPLTAAFALAMAAFQWWLSSPTWPRTVLVLLTVGVGLATKFSFPLFFGIGAVTLMVAAKKWPLAKGVVALVGAFVIVDAIYFFTKLPLFFKGFKELMQHNALGHDAYFLGQVRHTGWWYYFPVLVAIKTPIPMLLLSTIGAWIACRRRHFEVVIIPVLMLVSVLWSRLNLGLRHILPLYVLMSMLAAFAVVTLWTTRAKWPLAALGAWLLVNSALAHPDYLPWANALAGSHPERIALDSNFDWGQDDVRLRDECRRRGITALHVALFGTADLRRIGLPPVQPIDERGGAPGWYAISESIVIPAQVRDPNAYRWLTESRNFIRIGKTIRLYRVG